MSEIQFQQNLSTVYQQQSLKPTQLIDTSRCKKGLDPSKPLDHLFVLYDMGETEFLTPVINRLESDGKKNYRVLVMGIAAEIAEKKGLPKDKLITLNDLGVKKDVDRFWSKTQGLTEAEIELIHKKVRLKNLILSGASTSMIHYQLLREYDLDAKTFALWTNFDPTVAGDGQEVAEKVQGAAQVVLYPSQYVVDALPVVPSRYAIVGQPSLETFSQGYEKINPSEVREKLNIIPSQKVVAYLGGYEKDEDYREGFEYFVKCLSSSDQKETLFVIQPHPKSAEGHFERKVMAKYGVTNFLVPPPKVTNSQEVVAISEGPVLCHKSSVSIKVASLGREVAFILPPHETWTNALLDAQVSPRVSSFEAFQALFKNPSQGLGAADLYNMMGMPKDATVQVLNLIENRSKRWRPSFLASD